MTNAEWKIVDSDEKLGELKTLTTWNYDNSKTAEVFACKRNMSFYPNDISRSGYDSMNYHMLVEFDDRELKTEPHYIELVLIHCEYLSSDFLFSPQFNVVRLDSLNRCFVEDAPDIIMRCACLMYRVLEAEYLNLQESSYFDYLHA